MVINTRFLILPWVKVSHLDSYLLGRPLSDNHYYQQAEEIKKKIREVSHAPAHHLAIRAMQELFITNEHRLYHWVQDRVPLQIITWPKGTYALP